MSRDSDDHALALDALMSGEQRQLAEAAQLVDGFPDGIEETTGRHWILRAIADAPIASIEWMLDHGVDLAFCDEDGYTPMLAAIESARADRLEVLRRLIVAGAPLNAKGIHDWTPAHMAAARDDVAVLELLVDAGADLSIRTDIDGYATPLEEARETGCPRAVAFLESRSAQSHDDSPLPGWRCVAEDGHLDMVIQMLVNHDIRSELVPAGSLAGHRGETVWVKSADQARAAALVEQMAKALQPTDAGPWHCAGCGEENDATFDFCWQCGREHGSVAEPES